MPKATGWTKGWPAVTGYYWRRINDHDPPSLVRIVGDECRYTDGSKEERHECYEFAGPLRHSDFEQLAAIRTAAQDMLTFMEWNADPRKNEKYVVQGWGRWIKLRPEERDAPCSTVRHLTSDVDAFS